MSDWTLATLQMRGKVRRFVQSSVLREDTEIHHGRSESALDLLALEGKEAEPFLGFEPCLAGREDQDGRLCGNGFVGLGDRDGRHGLEGRAACHEGESGDDEDPAEALRRG